MTTAPRLPATIRSRSDSSRWEIFGLQISSPSIRPTRTAEIGPRKGRREIVSAVEAPRKAATSG